MMKKLIFILFTTLFVISNAYGENQRFRDGQNRVVGANPNKGKEAKEEARSKAKTGLRTWVVDERSGLTDSVVPDTVSHGFQNAVFTEGPMGLYGSLGNQGSPRLAKVFSLRPEMDYFIFAQPYDFFVKPMTEQHFTNTFSPITNITYNECGGSDNGEDHLIANYAVNINKDAGLGFKFDYLYNRGYHDNQSTSDFGFDLYGSVLKEQYKAHWSIFTNYLKTRENGGVIDDEYVKNPEKFPSSYTTKEIPTNLDKVWNKMHVNGAQLTHRYSLGFRKVVVKKDTTTKHDTLKIAGALDPVAQALGQNPPPNANPNKPSLTPQPPVADNARKGLTLNDIKAKATTAKQDSVKMKQDSTVFVPVTSFIHTLKFGSNRRKFLANQSLSKFYTNRYLAGDSIEENINNILLSNYLAVELSEGLNKYLSAGIRVFAQHDFNNYTMPGLNGKDKFNENRVTIGAQIFREQSKLLNYELTAQTSSDGKDWGEFALRGRGKLTLPLFNDSVSLALRANIVNQKPTFYYRHYQSAYLWWDNNNLKKQMTTHIGATLESKKLDMRISGDIYNITNYTYFATKELSTVTQTSTISTLNTYVAQSDKNINVVSLMANKNFNFGLINWETTLVYQATTDKYALPLPALTAYTNLYLKFKIAKVLHTEFGVDVRYFSNYYAPTYSPALGQFATQDNGESLVKVGNHPVINAYVNFHLKHTRFYVMANHINYSKDGGTTFGAAHYPINPFIIRFGLSWNFFN